MNLAMWSGPRNLSTAMMYSFAARPDCQVWDEPFYAAYLQATGLDHPMRDEVIAAGDTDPEGVIASCLAPPESGKSLFYQKHMSQHMIQGFSRDWINQCTNVFLIRHPARVIASYAAKRENPTLLDIGFVQQAEMFRQLRDQTGQTPVVIDSYDIRQAPEASLQALCAAIGIRFYREMLTWPSGGHAADGVWARHWYGAVWKSTGFAAPEADLPEIPDQLSSVLDGAMDSYAFMKEYAL